MAKAKDKARSGQEQAAQRIRVEYRDVGALIPYADNPRKNDAAVPRMAALIAEFGFKVPVIIRSGGEVIDGHLRLKAARSLGMKEVPVVVADEWTPEQARAFRLGVNRSAEWAEWDLDKLRAELDALGQEGFDLGLIGFADFTAEEIAALDAQAAPALPEDAQAGGARENGTAGPGDPGEPPADGPAATVTRPGDVWALGPHRLMCGGSDLGWCDAAIRRWQSFTGRDAELEADGRTFAAVAAERG